MRDQELPSSTHASNVEAGSRDPTNTGTPPMVSGSQWTTGGWFVFMAESSARLSLRSSPNAIVRGSADDPSWSPQTSSQVVDPWPRLDVHVPAVRRRSTSRTVKPFSSYRRRAPQLSEGDSRPAQGGCGDCWRQRLPRAMAASSFSSFRVSGMAGPQLLGTANATAVVSPRGQAWATGANAYPMDSVRSPGSSI